MSDDKLINQVNQLHEMITYQQGAIVSRTLMDSEKGTVTIFAFDDDQGLSEHTAPFDALAFLFEGHAMVSISGKKMTLQSGDVVIMPANKPHTVRAITQFKMMLIMIRS